jgi:uncharacterized cupredoxin-like copper-binding protein
MSEDASVKMPGKVAKIIPAKFGEPEKAQIKVDDLEDLYSEVRIENKLTDDKGDDVSLKPGAEVEVTVTADKDAVKKKE